MLRKELSKKRKQLLRKQIMAYTNELCLLLGEEPVKLLFTTHHHGIACVSYYKSHVFAIEIDLDKADDPETIILHEMAHVVLIRQRGMSKHTAKFRKLYSDLCQRFLYSELSEKIFNKREF